jgi:hypothetical protein
MAPASPRSAIARCTIARGVIAGPRGAANIRPSKAQLRWMGGLDNDRVQAGEPLASCRPLRADDCGPTIDAMAMVDMRGA